MTALGSQWTCFLSLNASTLHTSIDATGLLDDLSDDDDAETLPRERRAKDSPNRLRRRLAGESTCTFAFPRMVCCVA